MLAVKHSQKPQLMQSTIHPKNSVLNRGQRTKKVRGNSQSSASKSESVSCQAGCSRRSAIMEKEKKKNKMSKKIGIENYDKLFRAIQQFHGNLSSMPLDLLVTHSHPQQWVTQQYQTHRKLCHKLCAIREKCMTVIKGKQCRISCKTEQIANSGLSMQIDKNSIFRKVQYYQSKLQVVKIILQNIESNMGLLGKLHQPSSSKDDNINKQCIPTNNVINQNEIFNHQNGSINSEHKYSSSGRNSNQLNSNKSKKKLSSNRSLNSSQQKSNSMQKGKQSVKKWEQFMKLLSNDTIEKDNICSSKCSPQQQKQDNVCKQTIDNSNDYSKHLKQFRRITNMSEFPTQNQTQNAQMTLHSRTPLFSTCKTEDNLIQFHDKKNNDEEWDRTNQLNSLQSNKISPKKQDSNKVKTRRIKTKQYININQNYSGDGNKLKNLLNTFTNFMKTQQNVTTDRSINCLKQNKQNKFKYSISSQQQQINIQQIKPLLTQLSQLKLQLKFKNQQIQKFMIMQQQYQVVIELLKQKQIQTQEKSELSIEKIKFLENNNKNHQQQLNSLIKSEKQMKQMLKNQIIFVTCQQKQKQQIENQIKIQINANTKKEKQTQQKVKSLKKQLENSINNQKIATQKMQIYKQKYYKILHQNQLKKLIMDEGYNGKGDKIKQIWNILAQHKKSLQTAQEKHIDSSKTLMVQCLNKRNHKKKQYTLYSPTEGVENQPQEELFHEKNGKGQQLGIQSPKVNSQTMQQWKVSQY